MMIIIVIGSCVSIVIVIIIIDSCGRVGAVPDCGWRRCGRTGKIITKSQKFEIQLIALRVHSCRQHIFTIGSHRTFQAL